MSGRMYETVRLVTLAVSRAADNDLSKQSTLEVAVTHSQSPTIAARPTPFLGERENQRVVDLLERAERLAPYCPCGRHMMAVADGAEVWLECSSRSEKKTGLSGVFSRLTAFGHTRRMITELPSAN